MHGWNPERQEMNGEVGGASGHVAPDGLDGGWVLFRASAEDAGEKGGEMPSDLTDPWMWGQGVDGKQINFLGPR